MKSSTRSLLLFLWENLNLKRKRQLFILLALMLVSAACELLSLTLFFPFLNILNNPNDLSKVNYLNLLPFDIYSLDPILVMILTIIVFLLAITASGILRVLAIYVSYKLSALIGNDVSMKAYKTIINLDYQNHLNIDKSKIITSLTDHVRFTQRTIDNLLIATTSIIITFSVLCFLATIDINIIIIMISVFGPSYFLINQINKKKINIISKRLFMSINKQMQIIRESLLMIREVKTNKLEEDYIDNLRVTDRSLRISLAEGAFFAQYPRFFLEVIGFITISILALVIKSSNNSSNLLVSLGGFALACQRVIPLMQLAYSNLISVKKQIPSVKQIISILEMENIKLRDVNLLNYENKRYCFKEKIEINNLSFSYKNSEKKVLNNINLVLNKGDHLGIIGESGSGKSTFIDLLLGILEPSSGEILVDGKPLIKYLNYSFWKNQKAPISYVPQDFFIKEGTFLDNIIYNNNKKVNFDHAVECARKAVIKDFIESTQNSFYTIISENGKNLSGGQKQRLCIARALYNKPEILILDEATSALDEETSEKLLIELSGLDKKVTIISISHDLNCLKNCNRIIEIDKGLIINNNENLL